MSDTIPSDMIREIAKAISTLSDTHASAGRIIAAYADQHDRRVAELEAALAKRDAGCEPRPAYAGVLVWIGDKQVQQVCSEAEIRHERDTGNAITSAAQRCLDMLAASQQPAQKEE